MSCTRNSKFASTFALILVSINCSCDSNQSRSCLAGAERCSCKPDQSCELGLVCRSNVCVSEPGTSVGGNTGSTGASTTADNGGQSNLGGNSNATGGVSDTTSQGGSVAGASSAGGSANTGGTVMGLGGADQGGTNASGGVPIVTGGAPVATGGAPDATGGAPDATGGAPDATGGAPDATGGVSQGTGGSALAAGGSGVTLYPNQITNGDFSQGTANWHVMDSAGSLLSTGTIVNGAYCISPASSTLQYVGWPAASADAAYLQPGGSYVFIFRMKADSASVAFKVGEALSPYTPVCEPVKAASPMSVPTDWQTFSYSFDAGTSSFGVGVVFGVTISTGTFCIDDLILAMVSS
jgi:hypothetical protein